MAKLEKVTIPGLTEKAERGEKLTMLTAFDLPTARLLDQAGADVVLVGDSLGMVALGYSSTVPVTMEEVLHHAKAVRRGVSRALVVGDMPFMSFNISRKETVRNAGRFLKEAGCDAVKLEGGQGSEESIDAVRAILSAGIPVVGHLGLTPQTSGRLGGFRVQGKEAAAAMKLLDAALQLERAGCFGVLLECVPTVVAREISRRLRVPTFGIGAGPHCDGQVLVTHDLLNLTPPPVSSAKGGAAVPAAGPVGPETSGGVTGAFHPRFARTFARLDLEILRAVREFRREVAAGSFPSAKESYRMKAEQARAFMKSLRRREGV